MYKIVYIDDDKIDIHKFERDLSDGFEIETIHITEDAILENVFNKLLSMRFDYLIVDFHLHEKTGCGFEGDKIVKMFLSKFPHFPTMLLTNYDDAAIERANNLDVDKIHSKVASPEKIDLFITRVKKKIEQYKKRTKEAQDRVVALKEKAKEQELTANEEEEFLQLDSFLEEILDAHAPELPKEILSTNSERLQSLLKKTDELIEKLDTL